MAYIRTVMKGILGTVEVWSVGVNWGIVGLAPDNPNQAWTDGILARLLTYTTTANVPASLKVCMSTGLQLKGWRVELRAEDESILSVSEGNMAAPVPGTGAASKTPQDCLVVSLRTNTPGARGRGRMYWPALGTLLDANYQVTSPTPAAMAADMRTWLNAIGSQINLYFAGVSSLLVVALSVRSAASHVNRDVVSLQVGQILDTQRRRRDALFEVPVTVSYP